MAQFETGNFYKVEHHRNEPSLGNDYPTSRAVRRLGSLASIYYAETYLIVD